MRRNNSIFLTPDDQDSHSVAGQVALNKKQGVSGQSLAVSRDLKVTIIVVATFTTICSILICEVDIHDLTLCAGGKAQQRLPLADVDQGGADGERLPQEPLTEPGEETSNNEDVVSDPRNEPNIWGRELNCGKNE